MKLTKQLQVLACLQTGKYLLVDSILYTLVKGEYRPYKANVLPSGYAQVTLFNGRNKGIKVIAYLHHVIYLGYMGTYDPMHQIDHRDRNNRNNRIGNLRVVTAKTNRYNTKPRPLTRTFLRPIRAKEIEQIKELMSQGMSQAGIARALDLNRLSVRYTMLKIQAGLPLKWE